MAGETDEQKSEQSAFANLVLGAVSTFLGAVFFSVVVWLLEPLLAILPFWLNAIMGVSIVIALPYLGYVVVRLGGCSVGSEHRAWYERFRFGFLTDNYNGRYASGMGKAIVAIDRFFGDASDVRELDEAKPRPLGLFPKAFGLKVPAPLWTAASYDRSLLLAFLYPPLAMLVFWTIWGGASVGQAELALGLKPEPLDWKRAVWIGPAIAISVSLWLIGEAESWPAKLASLLFFIVAVAAGSAGAGDGANGAAHAVGCTLAVFVTLSHFFHDRLASAGAGAAIVAGFSSAIAVTVAVPLIDESAVIGIGLTTAVATIFLFSVSKIANLANQNKFMGQFLIILSTISLFISMGLTTITPGRNANYLIYFLIVLTFINAPFDWVAVGITRGLIRRGQQSGGIAPIITALIDLLLSLPLMAILAFAILWVTELYNCSAISSGGRAVIDVPAYLAAMNDPAQRSDPKYYWLYAMLFSSQIPAIANFSFSALCLLRGAPFINRKIAQMLPESGTIGTWHRGVVSSLAAGQMAVAVAIGLGLYYALVVGLIAIIDPLFGEGLLSVLSAAQITPLLG